MADVTVSSIQSGSQAIASGDGLTINIAITAVDLSRSIVMITQSNAANETRSKRHLFRADLSTSTNVRLIRHESSFAKDVIVEWTVVEFDTGVIQNIQSGSVDRTNAVQNTTLTAVDLGKSFVVTSLTTNLSILSTSVPATASLSSTTNLVLESATAPTSGQSFYNYQVVEFLSTAGVDIQQVSSTVVADAGTNVQTITAVDTEKTFIASGGFLTDASLNVIIRGSATLDLTSTTEVTATRTTAGSELGNATFNYYVVELTGSANKVEKIDVTFLATDTSKTASWTALSTTKTALFDTFSLGNRVIRVTSGGSADNNNNLFSVSLNPGADGATVTRGGADDAYRVISCAVDFTAGVTGPNTPINPGTTNLLSTSVRLTWEQG